MHSAPAKKDDDKLSDQDQFKKSLVDELKKAKESIVKGLLSNAPLLTPLQKISMGKLIDSIESIKSVPRAKTPDEFKGLEKTFKDDIRSAVIKPYTDIYSTGRTKSFGTTKKDALLTKVEEIICKVSDDYKSDRLLAGDNKSHADERILTTAQQIVDRDKLRDVVQHVLIRALQALCNNQKEIFVNCIKSIIRMGHASRGVWDEQVDRLEASQLAPLKIAHTVPKEKVIDVLYDKLNTDQTKTAINEKLTKLPAAKL